MGKIKNKDDIQAELNNCSFAKCILMLLVVLGHSVHMWTGDWFTKNPVFTSKYLGFLSEFLSGFHVYSFALISGYVFYYIKFERNGYNNFLKFLVNKAKRLVVPYIFVCTLWVAPVQQWFFHYDTKTLIMKYLLATSPNQLWFLIMLFDVFIIAFFLCKLWDKREHLSLILNIALFFIAGAATWFGLPNIFQITTALSYVTVFWVGFLLRKSISGKTFYGNLIRKIPCIVYSVAYLLLFLLLRYLDLLDGAVFKMLRGSIQYPEHICGALMGFSILQYIGNKISWQNNKAISFLTDKTMGVYLFHQQFVYFSLALLNGIVCPIVNALINFIFSTVLSLLITSILLKFKTTRFLIGLK